MFKPAEYKHGTRRTEESFTHNIEESKTANNLGIGALFVGAIIALSAMGNIQDADLAEREILLEQRERQMQTQP